MKTQALLLAAVIAASSLTTSPLHAESESVPSPIGTIIKVIPWLLKEREQYYFVSALGHGRTVQEAQTNALQAAVEQAVGSVVNSERVVVDNQLMRSEIVQYAAGFVDRYEVTQVQEHGKFVAVTVDVYVKRSRLSDRLLGVHTLPGKIDGNRLAAQTETLNHSRTQGDRLLQTVLNDFPKLAFVIHPGPSRVYYTAQRQRQLELSFKLQWRPQYLESLRMALSQVGQNANAGDCVGSHARLCQYQHYVTVSARPGKHGWRRTIGFDDSVTYQITHDHLINSRPAVLITIFDAQGQQIWHGCQRWSELDNVLHGHVANERLIVAGDQNLQINGYLILDARVPMNLTPTTPVLDRVDMQVVRNNQCPN